jgi:GTP pyrophosphokinase
MAKSTKARNRIRHFLNQEEQKRSLSLGQEILEKEARKQGLSFSKILKSDTLNEAVRELGFTRVDKMIAAVGFGKLSALHVLHPFMPEQEVPEPGTVKARPRVRKKREGIKIHGFDDILVNFSKCCNPVPGDEVLGFITRGQGVSIHRIHCPNVGGGTVNSDRVVDVQWNLKEETVRPVRISVITSNRPGILADISAKISSEEINISAADIRIRKDGKSVCNFELEIRNRRDLDRILHAISRTKDVLEVKRTASAF